MSEILNQPLVTVAIPTYNCAKKYLPSALSSALAQTYNNLEIIVSDNFSTDNTYQLVNSYNDERLKYVKQKNNIGANGNFNFCLKEAKGEYILFLCDDDLIDPDFISTCISKSTSSDGHSFIRTGARVIDSTGKIMYEAKNIVQGKNPEQLFNAWFNNTTSWYLCNTLFNTYSLRKIGGMHSLHNVLEDCYAITKLSTKCDWIDIEDIKAKLSKIS